MAAHDQTQSESNARQSALSMALSKPVQAVRDVAGVTRARWYRFRAASWEEYYCQLTKRDSDFRALVGSPDDFALHREWQFELMQDHGLQPEETLLDLGCGVLRSGTAFIDYLDRDNYVGMDISETALTHARRRVTELDLEAKQPTLIQNEDLRFDEVAAIEADYLLAQSVWSHLPPDRLDNCLAHMGRALADDGTVIATYNEADGDDPSGVDYDVDFAYDHAELVERAATHGWQVNRVDAVHPNGQTVVRLDRDRET